MPGGNGENCSRAREYQRAPSSARISPPMHPASAFGRKPDRAVSRKTQQTIKQSAQLDFSQTRCRFPTEPLASKICSGDDESLCGCCA